MAPDDGLGALGGASYVIAGVPASAANVPPLGTYRTSAATRPTRDFSALTVAESETGPALVDSSTGEVVCAAGGEIEDQNAARARIDSRVHKWVLQAAVRQLMPNHLTAFCCRSVLPVERRGIVGVEIWKSAQHGTAHYGNLMTCGYVWSCPVCAPKVAARRAEEVERAITKHQAQGGRVGFLTLTVPHYERDDLAVLLPDFTEALRSFWSRRAVKDALKLAGFVGSIRALEVTNGRNGWHPHTHYLMFGEFTTEQLDLLKSVLYVQWAITVSKKLGRQINGHGFTLELVGGGAAQGGTDEDAAQLARYVVKSLEDSVWGPAQEMTKGHIKKGRMGGRTPFALLHDYATGDDQQAGALFVEFVRTFHGRRQLTWSKGLRGRLLDQEEETSDQDLAAQLVESASLLGTMTLDQWRRVLAAPRRDTRGLLLEIAAAGGWPAVETFLDTLPEYRRGQRA